MAEREVNEVDDYCRMEHSCRNRRVSGCTLQASDAYNEKRRRKFRIHGKGAKHYQAAVAILPSTVKGSPKEAVTYNALRRLFRDS